MIVKLNHRQYSDFINIEDCISFAKYWNVSYFYKEHGSWYEVKPDGTVHESKTLL